MENFRLYHGTFCAIHETDRRFLDPNFAKRNGDDGDPETKHVFATPDKLQAKQFALRTRELTTNLTTSEGPVAVYIGSPPDKDAKGYVYEVGSDGFRETLRRDKPSGMWAILEEDSKIMLCLAVRKC